MRPVVEAALAKSPADRPAARDILDQLTSLAGHPTTPGEEPTQFVLSRTWLLPAPEHAVSVPGHRRFLRLPILAGAVALAAMTGAGAAYVASPAGHTVPEPSDAGFCSRRQHRARPVVSGTFALFPGTPDSRANVRVARRHLWPLLRKAASVIYISGDGGGYVQNSDWSS